MIGPWVIPSSPPPGGFVMDATVPAAWLFTTTGSAYTSGVLGRIQALGSCVPGWWTLDLVAALRAGERQGLRSAAEVDRFLSPLPQFRIYVEDDTPALAWPDIISVSRRQRVSVERAAYLELALRLSLPLATNDPALTRAAAAAGAPLFTP
ncbi:MAG: VapC toxin family PIN domain ribonuclease [Isosphaera sp.]|nr:VapC toxin family PIN domain ribonuclease [Isosphaera sp.]